METFFNNHWSIISSIFVLIVTLLLLFIKNYFSEKGKLKALISENKKLVEQSEYIKLKYSQQLEELKKEHQLDISKRKYQYESKKEQYLKFFRLLDDFSSQNNVKTQQKFLPILDEFNRNYLNAAQLNNGKKQTNAATVFSKKVQQLMFDSNQELIRIKQETNTIRLIASREIIDQLDLLTIAYDKSMDDASKMMKELSGQILLKDEHGIKGNQSQIESSARVIDYLRAEIVNLMRNELNEI